MADITVCGRLTKDPESRQVKDRTLAKFSLADSDYFRKTSDGQNQTIYFDCEAWGPTASTVDRFCTKGSRVKVAGQLTPNWWTNKSGELVRGQVLKVDRVMLLDPKGKSAQEVISSAFSGQGTLNSDDIPF